MDNVGNCITWDVSNTVSLFYSVKSSESIKDRNVRRKTVRCLSDPNYASVMCRYNFLSLYYLFSKKYTNKWLLSGIILSIFLNVSYIILSGSRNGLITLLMTTFVLFLGCINTK